MNQSISNAMLFNMAIIFVAILLAFFVGSLSYSKASKVNNRIIEEIEKYGEAAGENQAKIDSAYSDAYDNIISWLQHGDEAHETGIGYRQVRGAKRPCPSVDTIKKETEAARVEDVTAKASAGSTATNQYEYCVYRIKNCTGNNKGCYTYYRVVTYMYFDIPLLDELRLPINGETMGFRTRNS